MLLAIAVLVAFAQCGQQSADCSKLSRVGQEQFAAFVKDIGNLTLNCSLVLKSAEKLQRENGDYLYSRKSTVLGVMSDYEHLKDLISKMPKSEIKNGNYSYYGCSWRRKLLNMEFNYDVLYAGTAACVFRKD